MKYKEQNTDNQVKSFLGAGGTREAGGACTSKSSLGNNAKSFHTKTPVFDESKGLDSNCSTTLVELVCEDTGEVSKFKTNSFGNAVEDVTTDKIITERFLLQSAVRYLMPTSRTAKCTRLSCGSDIGILKSVEHKKTSFTGLQTCGSPWSCPVCSSKISERRKNEVVQALESHISQGGQLYFVTFTFRHSKEQSLKELREKQKIAFAHLRKSRGYLKYKKLVGYSGLIRALEVTWGQSNGFHPHTHEIIFSDNKVSFQSIKRLLFPVWVDACKKAGLPAPSFRRGIDVQGGEKAGAYITKYGNELTKSHLKKARGDRFTPYDLLRSYFFENVKLHGAKFVEFSEGMQGSRQLYWTNGLKDRFGINDKSDEDLAKESQENSFLLGNITVDYWRSVIKYKARATVLILAKDHGFEKVDAFIHHLYLNYLTSGDKAKDDFRILLNKERRKVKIKSSFENRLLTVDDRNYFEKLNDKIIYDQSLKLAALSSPELTKFTDNLTAKLLMKQKQRDFIADNYSTK